MTATVEPNPEATRPELTENGEGGRGPSLFGGRYGTTSLRVGAASIWLSVIVLLPLAAILWQAAGGGWHAFWLAITSNAALESFRVTLTISAGVTLVNLVFGLLVAWVLTRDDFPGKRLVDSVIDLPFALPTIVASLVMLALYGPNSPVDLHLQHTKWGVGVALLFVTLPFVVRSVQPVLLELDRETEEAAASLGANNWTIFTLVILPALLPSLLYGAGLTFSPAVRHLLRYLALAYIGILVIIPVGLILWRTFQPGIGEFFASISTPAAVSALELSLLVVAIVVPLNVLFGVPTALVLARNRFRGKNILQAIIDLPFAVSPIVVGVSLILLWGSAGLFGFVENNLGLKIIFGFPGIVLASIFVTVPFVIREVEPVLHEIGTDQEEAAATLGSQWWQTFWKVTLPSIRWGLTYGIVLTIARTLGEFGAVTIVAANLPGASQTLTLLVADRYNRGSEYGAYAISTLLMTVAVLVLVVQVILDSRRAN